MPETRSIKEQHVTTLTAQPGPQEQEPATQTPARPKVRARKVGEQIKPATRSAPPAQTQEQQQEIITAVAAYDETEAAEYQEPEPVTDPLPTATPRPHQELNAIHLEAVRQYNATTTRANIPRQHPDYRQHLGQEENFYGRPAQTTSAKGYRPEATPQQYHQERQRDTPQRGNGRASVIAVGRTQIQEVPTRPRPAQQLPRRQYTTDQPQPQQRRTDEPATPRRRAKPAPMLGYRGIIIAGSFLVLGLMLLGAFLATVLPTTMQNLSDTRAYGYPRTARYDVQLGHYPGSTSHIEIENLNGKIEISEQSNGQKLDPKLYPVITLTGKDAAEYPATIQFLHLDGDRKLDMLITVKGIQIPMYNTGSSFQSQPINHS